MAWRPTLVRRLSLLSETALWQAGVAAVGFASGIAVVRLLDVEQYAIYTIANSLLGALVVLGDSGISSGVMSQGGSVWRDRSKLGAVVNTAMQICRWFAVAAAVVAIPAAVFLLGRHGSSLVLSLAVSAVLIPCFVLSIRNSVLQIPIKLHQDVRPLQSIQLGSNIVRLLLLGAVLPFAPYALIALGAAAVSTAYANVQISRRGHLYMHEKSQRDPVVRKEIMRIVWRMLPGSTYYAMLGQVTIWLLSVFGNTDSIAQLGALGRLAMITSVASAVTATLLVPRFARLPDERTLLLRRFLFMVLGMSCACLIGVGISALFPTQILWVLGNNYGNLQMELVLVALTAAMTLLGGLCVSLSFSKGIVPNPLALIPYSVATYALFIAINDVSTLRGVLLMGLGTATCQLGFNAIYLWLRAGKSAPH